MLGLIRAEGQNMLYPRERVLIARMLVALAQQIHRYWYGHPFIGPQADTFFPAACVFIAYAEGRPITATDLASFLGISRNTIVHKLESLVAKGVLRRVGLKYYIVEDLLNDPRSHLQVRKLMKIITNTADQLRTFPVIPDIDQ